MFDIRICTIGESDDLRGQWATKTVSLLDPTLQDRMKHYRSTPDRLCLFFDDVNQRTSFSGFPPTAEHLDRILAFTRRLTDNDHLLVHCHAGVSRSTAAAIAVLMQHGMDHADALSHVAMLRPQLWPNDLIVSFTDDRFGLGGAYIDHMRQFKKSLVDQVYIGDNSAKSVNLMRSFIDAMKFKVG